MLTHADVCSRRIAEREMGQYLDARMLGMLTYAHVCSRMLTYADVCSRRIAEREMGQYLDARMLGMLTYADV